MTDYYRMNAKAVMALDDMLDELKADLEHYDVVRNDDDIQQVIGRIDDLMSNFKKESKVVE